MGLIIILNTNSHGILSLLIRIDLVVALPAALVGGIFDSGVGDDNCIVPNKSISIWNSNKQLI